MYHKLLAAILILAAVVYVASFGSSVGHSIDDGIHIVAAKALALGEGLVMISDPASPPATQFPPAHSLFLVPVLLLFPDPPESTIPLQVVSALFALIFVLISWFWLRRYVPPATALLMTGLVAFNPETVRFAGAVMAEMGYAATSMAALLFFEKATEDREQRPGYNMLLLVTVMMTMAYLFRSVGIALLLALPGLFILKRRIGRAGSLIIGFLILASPWLFKSAFIGTPEYRTQFWLLDLENPTSGLIDIWGLFDRMWINGVTYATTTLPNHLLATLGSQRIIQYSEQLGISLLLLMIQLTVTALVLIGFIRQLRSGLRGVELYMLVYGGM
ncbi:MAG: glycosyltransferase family 39 protein, partial [Candidatus Latescibacteria bacterium]|nr:glycosyltransferase family 39 protein [Candidatus Latescibacterota bacterium]